MVNLSDIIIQLYSGNQSITNRTIVLHALPDDGGMGNASSAVTGWATQHDYRSLISLFCSDGVNRNAGPRLACGLIKVQSSTATSHAAIFSLILSTLIGLMLCFHWRKTARWREHSFTLASFSLKCLNSSLNIHVCYFGSYSPEHNHHALSEHCAPWIFAKTNETPDQLDVEPMWRQKGRPSVRLWTTQTTMYDYASSVSYRHKQFYSTLDNTVTSKTIVKGEKRPLTVGIFDGTRDSLVFIYPQESQDSSPICKKSKTVGYIRPSSSPPSASNQDGRRRSTHAERWTGHGQFVHRNIGEREKTFSNPLQDHLHDQSKR